MNAMNASLSLEKSTVSTICALIIEHKRLFAIIN